MRASGAFRPLEDPGGVKLHGRAARRWANTREPPRPRRGARSTAPQERASDLSASRLVSGSSRSTTPAPVMNVIATRRRWRWPIDIRSTLGAGELTERERVDRVLDGVSQRACRGRHHRDACPELQLVADRQPRVEPAVTGGEERDELLVAGAVLGGRSAPRPSRVAGVGLDQARGDPQHRRLACAVAPADPCARVPRSSVEVEAVEHRRADPCAIAWRYPGERAGVRRDLRRAAHPAARTSGSQGRWRERHRAVLAHASFWEAPVRFAPTTSVNVGAVIGSVGDLHAMGGSGEVRV